MTLIKEYKNWHKIYKIRGFGEKSYRVRGNAYGILDWKLKGKIWWTLEGTDSIDEATTGTVDKCFPHTSRDHSWVLPLYLSVLVCRTRPPRTVVSSLGTGGREDGLCNRKTGTPGLVSLRSITTLSVYVTPLLFPLPLFTYVRVSNHPSPYLPYKIRQVSRTSFQEIPVLLLFNLIFLFPYVSCLTVGVTTDVLSFTFTKEERTTRFWWIKI